MGFCCRLFILLPSCFIIVAWLPHDTFSHPQQGRIDFNTVVHCCTPSLCYLGGETSQKSKYQYRDHLVGQLTINTANPSLSRGMDFLIHPSFWWSTDTISSSCPINAMLPSRSLLPYYCLIIIIAYYYYCLLLQCCSL